MSKITVQTGSETTPRIYALLQNAPEREFTYAEMAQELGFDKVVKVLGAANGLKKKGLLVDGAVVVNDGKEYKTLKIADPATAVEFVEKVVSDKELSDGAIDVLKVLSNGEAQVAADMGAILNKQAIAITGVCSSLVKKGLIAKDKVKVVVAGVEKEITQYKITDAGITKVQELMK